MTSRPWRLAYRHRAGITLALVSVLLVNLLVVARVQPASASVERGLPVGAQCQGGGPGCLVQPMIPPPAGALPHIDAPPTPSFGMAVLVAPKLSASIHEAPPGSFEHPPQLPSA
jgi:hypothetical protein